MHAKTFVDYFCGHVKSGDLDIDVRSPCDEDVLHSPCDCHTPCNHPLAPATLAQGILYLVWPSQPEFIQLSTRLLICMICTAPAIDYVMDCCKSAPLSFSLCTPSCSIVSSPVPSMYCNHSYGLACARLSPWHRVVPCLYSGALPPH